MLKTANQKMSILLMIISIFYLIYSYLLPSYPFVPVDSDLVPIGLGFILLGLSIALYFIKDKKSDNSKLPTKSETIMLLSILGFILTYIIFLEIIGFIIITALFIFFCSWFLGYKKFITNALVSVLMPLFFYFLFQSFLQIQLPKGILPF